MGRRGLPGGPAAPEGARPREGPLRDRGPRHHPPGPDRRGGLRGREGGGAPGRLPDRGGRGQHRPRGRQPAPDPLHPHPRRPHRRHRRVRLLHDGRGGAPALPGRAAGARAPVDDLAPLPAVARGRGDGPHAGRRRDWAGSARAWSQKAVGFDMDVLCHSPLALRRPRRLRRRPCSGVMDLRHREGLSGRKQAIEVVLARGRAAAGRLRLAPRAPDPAGHRPRRPPTT